MLGRVTEGMAGACAGGSGNVLDGVRPCTASIVKLAGPVFPPGKDWDFFSVLESQCFSLTTGSVPLTTAFGIPPPGILLAVVLCTLPFCLCDKGNAVLGVMKD